MKIGIDARFVGPEGTGLGKYTEKLVNNLALLDKTNTYKIFLRKNNWNFLKLQNKNFTKVLADIPWYSIEEQIKLPYIFNSQKLDILHIPHFNVPVLYKRKFIVTIHDLIHHHFQEGSTSTKNPVVLNIKRTGYKFVIHNAVKKSQKIIVPSQFVKDETIKHFKVDPLKITITYEAAEEEYLNKPKTNTKRTNNLIYVGNIYPHKNLNKLLDALNILKNQKSNTNHWKLIIVCPRNIFFSRLQKEISKRNLSDCIETKDYLTPNQLKDLFNKSNAYVFPTLSEGFGIPGLNAMACDLPVICSDIPILKEIYQDAALYFEPTNPSDIAQKIKVIFSDERTRSDLVLKGREQIKKYSWQKMAKETLKIYEQFQ